VVMWQCTGIATSFFIVANTLVFPGRSHALYING
jgi:hypothetical protein